MPIPVSDILKRTDDLLLDEVGDDGDRVRWPNAERIRWANDAMGAILNRKPGALAQRVVHALAAGTYQALQANGSMLLDVVRNIGADGVAPGLPVRRTDRQLLDDSDPTWHQAKPKVTIKHFTFDDRTPKVFYVYPPAIAGTKVELLHAALPAAVAEDDLDGSFDIGAEYLEAVVNFVCYRAFSKDSEFANAAIAGGYYQAFEAALGMKAAADINASPNQPGNSV